MDTSRVGLLLSLPVLLQLAAGGGPPRPGAPPRGCPTHCQCEPDGRMLLRVDCSDLGLSELPSNLSVFTSYLDLSMNNISQLPPNPLHSLRFLEELRLAGNALTYIPKGAFTGLYSLKVLMLQNNQLRQVPTEALQNLRSLQSLIGMLHFQELFNDMTVSLLLCCTAFSRRKEEAAVDAKQPPVGLSGMLQNNQLRQVPTEALQNLRSLQSLIGMLHFQELFNDMTVSLLLCCTAFSRRKEEAAVDAKQPPVGLSGRLDANHISYVPSSCFSGLHSLRHLWLDDNALTEIPVQAFRSLSALQAMTLALNKIHHIPDYAFGNLSSLVVLTLNGASQITEFPDLTGTANLESLTLTGAQISSLPQTVCDQLPNLQVLDLRHNEIHEIKVDAFQQLLSLRSLVIEMPYAYQCCAFGVCENIYKISNQWNKGDNSSMDDLHKKDTGMFQFQDERDLEDFLLDIEEDLKALHSVQCSPSPGPFKPCEHLFGSWLIRIGVWIIAVLALTCNALVTSTVFRSPVYISSIKLLIGVIAMANFLMGVPSAMLAGVDAFTFGSFAQHGAWWENGVSCQVVGFLSIFASESSVFLLTLAALERGFSIKCSAKFETKTLFASLKAIILLCALLALTIAVVPLLGGSEYSASPLCLPLPFGEPSTTGYMVALVLLNSLCFLVMTIAYTKLYCNLEKGDLENIWDCAMVKHIALLLFTNCILYCPVAFLSFSSLLNLTFISPEVIKFILLVTVPLPACLNPLLYILFNPHFKEDLGSLGKQTHFWTRSKHSSLMSINSDDVEKQSCDSTQALVTFTSASIAYDLPSNSISSPAYPMTESCHLSSVAFVPCL
ncbi:Leucine-rich repeat-containing G-protein coupled receptor 5 [Tupaia chinensis]|uniref:Leucine-rich repeat-containing G-protein coupled receptor 5 n=1 Tax=Tupaia chinensis TaxID=246437 RepID=L9KYV1_TUPCH|nr:Leucine-rich repeat-containing G-protein coupled receptor 5 [Tupaia chinensis]